MKRVMVLGALLLAGCAPQLGTVGQDGTDSRNVSRVRYEQDGVTCYVFNGGYAGGISCLRDPIPASE